jgi:hypothetical protein
MLKVRNALTTNTIDAHPALTEGIVEAADAIDEKAINIFNSSLQKNSSVLYLCFAFEQ